MLLVLIKSALVQKKFFFGHGSMQNSCCNYLCTKRFIQIPPWRGRQRVTTNRIKILWITAGTSEKAGLYRSRSDMANSIQEVIFCIWSDFWFSILD